MSEVKQVVPVRVKILDEAKILVTGPRAEQYGDPAVSFMRQAEIMTAIQNREVTPLDAVNSLISVKLSRLANNPHDWDGWVDLAGYSALGAEVVWEFKEKYGWDKFLKASLPLTG